jgi:hypothetical protein
LDPLKHRPGLAQNNVWVYGRIDRSVNRHQVANADELVQLDVVHMPLLSYFRRMQDDEHVVVVGVHLWETVLLHGVLHGHGMKPEHLREHMHCLLVTGGNVHSYETVLTLEQLLQLVDATILDHAVANKTNVHSTHSLSRACTGWRLSSRATPGSLACGFGAGDDYGSVDLAGQSRDGSSEVGVGV